MNKVTLLGRLTKDPEVRYTQTGIAVTSFTLAVNRKFARDENQQADFIPIVVWDKLAEICGNYLQKGRQVLIEGRIQIRSYDTQNGNKRYVTEVIAQEVEFVGSNTKNNTSVSSPTQKEFGTEIPPDEKVPF